MKEKDNKDVAQITQTDEKPTDQKEEKSIPEDQDDLAQKSDTTEL